MNQKHTDNIKTLEALLNKLLSAPSIKYSKWPNADIDAIKDNSGVYHFYKKTNKGYESLYIGKGAVSENKWNLYKRICQHFQVSQKNALLGKAAIYHNKTPREIKKEFANSDVYLQWLFINPVSTIDRQHPEKNLIWVECFCKSILNPKYTDL